MNGRLEGRRVLLTGAGGGQGLCALELFCAHGATVHGCDVKAGAAEESAARLREDGLSAHGSTVDLGDPDAAAAWVHSAAAAMGGLDIVYNNAGAPVFAPIAELTVEQWRFTIRNELDIIFFVTSPAWRYLRESRAASVINTASVSGTLGNGGVGQTAHAAAKSGVLALTRQLAAEGAADGIRVNSISPSFVETPGSTAVSRETRDWIVATFHMIPRAGTPQDIAAAALFLASAESAFITGIDLRVDAGRTAGTV